jgi:hypothetical protein
MRKKNRALVRCAQCAEGGARGAWQLQRVSCLLVCAAKLRFNNFVFFLLLLLIHEFTKFYVVVLNKLFKINYDCCCNVIEIFTRVNKLGDDGGCGRMFGWKGGWEVFG